MGVAVSLDVLERLPDGAGTAPRWRVRCPSCRVTYAICAWRANLARIERCASCEAKERARGRMRGAGGRFQKREAA